jgi:flagellar motor protein MotB
MKRRKFATQAADEENPYWMSFSDIMSALMVIFVLASVVLILQLMERQRAFDEQVAALAKAEEVRRTILEEARDELLRRNIQVTISENDTVLTIPNRLLGFDTGRYDLLPVYEDTAREIGEVIHLVTTRDDRPDYLDTIFIEGHTDRRAYNNDSIKGNWGLSTFRAISLWHFWIENMPAHANLAALTNPEGKPLFSVSGYAETRPVRKEQITEDDFQANRRIDIRFTIHRPAQEEYRRIQIFGGGAG